MHFSRIGIGFVGMLVAIATLVAEPVEIGISRADLLARHGKPASTATKGGREILIYPEGRVTVEKGVVTAFEPAPAGTVRPAKPAPVVAEPASVAPADPLRPRVDPRAAKAGWLSNLDDAIARATAENKPILFLLSGNMDQCPWGKKFSELVEYNGQFLRKLGPDYVPLRINISEMGGSFEAASTEEVDRMAARVRAFMDLRSQIFSSEMIPGLAVLSADGKQSTEVDMAGALEAVAKGDLDGYTLRQLAAARAAPRKELKVATAGVDRSRFVYLVIGLVVLVVVIKKIAG